MKTRILLVNFTEAEQEKVCELGVECDLGYISDCYWVAKSTNQQIEVANFFSPSSIYEYKAIFVKLTKKPPLEDSYHDKAKPLAEEDIVNSYKYWMEKGFLTIFLEENGFSSFQVIGIPHLTLNPASKGDATVKFGLKSDNHPFRQALEEMKSSIIMPPAKYIEVTKRRDNSMRWSIIDIYGNLNDQPIGVYYNAVPDYTDKDAPSFIVLPHFKEYTNIIVKLLKAFSQLQPQYLSEIYASDWVESEKYYPVEVSLFDEQIANLIETTKKKLEELEKAKNEAKQKYSFLRSILYETGDNLKDAVIRVLSEIWKLEVRNMDAERKSDFREDILIHLDSDVILGEIKGTRNQNPTLSYVTQLLTHIRKSDYKDAEGALILNYDLTKDPQERTNAYTKNDEAESLEDIFFIDTRVLFNLSIAIIDQGLPLEEAKKILFQKGRATFNLEEYVKGKMSNSM